ncbi:amidase family protein [Texcoconibacillus texcoconensis]|uniref:Amidase n=1 Tax=Texcoconibacillus texcoconensis TaxID=1095777 RepID=A0A840QLS7_9BACI|nr:amidase family protein [Texcoconibacillus texcoconensis]MBB5172303.1 amidase [Texcoconibacillus texcoconensis]
MENPKLNHLSETWLLEATMNDMQMKMTEGELTAKEIVLMYLHRIAMVDKQGPQLNSVLEVNPDAIYIAEKLDREREEQGERGPLHGIPVLIKDNIDTGDKMHTSAGSLAIADHYASDDAFLVQKLREAGAVILGKTNLTEWANFMTNGMPPGYSSRGGQVLNPYGPGVFPVGGSSSGSGAAVAANLAAISVGTETSGSILSPASQNSLVGIKPTVGMVSRRGIIPISHTQDTAGPIARTVTDAVKLLSVMTEKDDDDPVTSTQPSNQPDDWQTALDTSALKGARIGIVREGIFDVLDEEKKNVANRAITQLEALGATVIDEVVIPSAKAKWNVDVLIHEFKNGLNDYLRNVNSKTGVSSLTELITYNHENRDKMLRYGQSLLLSAEKISGTLTDPAYLQSLEHDQYYASAGGIDAALKGHNLNALLFVNNLGAMIPAKAGYPSVTVPTGYTEQGEPVGITFTGTAYSEPMLIGLAYSFEQGTKVRRGPKL